MIFFQIRKQRLQRQTRILKVILKCAPLLIVYFSWEDRRDASLNERLHPRDVPGVPPSERCRWKQVATRVPLKHMRARPHSSEGFVEHLWRQARKQKKTQLAKKSKKKTKKTSSLIQFANSDWRNWLVVLFLGAGGLAGVMKRVLKVNIFLSVFPSMVLWLVFMSLFSLFSTGDFFVYWGSEIWEIKSKKKKDKRKTKTQQQREFFSSEPTLCIVFFVSWCVGLLGLVMACCVLLAR